MLTITVKTLDSNNHEFEVDDAMTVAEFKRHIAETVSVVPERQRLIHCGRVLHDDQPLSSYSLHGKAVHLVQRSPPPPPSTSTSSSSASTFSSSVTADSQRQPMVHSTVVTPLLLGAISMRGGGGVGGPAGATGVGGAAGQGGVPVGTSSSGARLGHARNMIQLANHVLDSCEAGRAVPPTGGNTPSSSSSSNNNNQNNNSDASQPAASTFSSSSSSGNSTGATIVSQASPAASAAAAALAAANADSSTAGPTLVHLQPMSASGAVDSRSPLAVIAHPGLPVFARVIDMLAALMSRLMPHVRLYQRTMAADAPTDAAGEAQRRVYHTSEALHYAAHALHLVSDMLVDLSRPPPRHIRARPVVFAEHHTVTATMQPLQASVNVMANRVPPQQQQQQQQRGSTDSSSASVNRTVDGGDTQHERQRTAGTESSAGQERSASEQTDTANTTTAAASPMDTEHVHEVQIDVHTVTDEPEQQQQHQQSSAENGGGGGGVFNIVQAIQNGLVNAHINVAHHQLPAGLHESIHQAAASAAHQAVMNAALQHAQQAGVAAVHTTAPHVFTFSNSSSSSSSGGGGGSGSSPSTGSSTSGSAMPPSQHQPPVIVTSPMMTGGDGRHPQHPLPHHHNQHSRLQHHHDQEPCDPFLQCHSWHLATHAARQRQLRDSTTTTTTSTTSSTTTAVSSSPAPVRNPGCVVSSSIRDTAMTAATASGSAVSGGVSQDHARILDSVPDHWRQVISDDLLVMSSGNPSASSTSSNAAPFSDGYLRTQTSSRRTAATSGKPPAGPISHLLMQCLEESLADQTSSAAAATAVGSSLSSADRRQLCQGAASNTDIMAEMDQHVTAQLTDVAASRLNAGALEHTDEERYPHISRALNSKR